MPTNAEQQHLRILYFARLGEQLGCTQEDLPLPEGVHTVAQLRAFLTDRGNRWQALTDSSIRTAVNQTIVKRDCELSPTDEVAFFPPVTGG